MLKIKAYELLVYLMIKIKENFWIFNNDEVLFRFNEHTPVMKEEIKEVLK